MIKIIIATLLICLLSQSCQENVKDEIEITYSNIDNSLTKSEKAIKEKTKANYELIFKDTTTIWCEKAKTIELITKEISNFLVSECSYMIKEVEKEDWHTVDEDGNYCLKDDRGIKSKDNYEVSTKLFVEDNNGQRGKMIRERIHLYRDSLCQILSTYRYGDNDWSFSPTYDGESLVEFDSVSNLIERSSLNSALKFCNPIDSSKVASVYLILSLPKYYLNQGQLYTWEKTMFEHAPIVAAKAMFEAYILDICNSESIAIEHICYNKIEESGFKFNKIIPFGFNDSVLASDTIK